MFSKLHRDSRTRSCFASKSIFPTLQELVLHFCILAQYNHSTFPQRLAAFLHVTLKLIDYCAQQNNSINTLHSSRVPSNAGLPTMSFFFIYGINPQNSRSHHAMQNNSEPNSSSIRLTISLSLQSLQPIRKINTTTRPYRSSLLT
jgi:hypothetical protein